MTRYDATDIKRRMEGAIRVLREEFSGLRTGRASASLLEPVSVEAYGQTMRIADVATVSVPEPRMISVQVWDEGNAKAVDRAIRESQLGLNPILEGNVLRVPLPELTEERRREFVRTADRYAEDTRVAIRNVRQDAMNSLRRMQRAGEFSEDEHRATTADVQKWTDDFVAEVDELLKAKHKDIMQV